MTNSATQAIRKTGLEFDAAEFATLSAEELRKMDADWRASNYLSVGQIYLFENPDLIVACVVGDGEAEVVMASCGDFPTPETLAAVDLIRKHIPELKVRAVNMIKRKFSLSQTSVKSSDLYHTPYTLHLTPYCIVNEHSFAQRRIQ